MTKADRQARADALRGHAINIEFLRIYLIDALRGLTLDEVTEAWWEANGYADGKPSAQIVARQYTERVQA